MGTRYLVTVNEDADPERVADGLREAGADDVVAPRPELPGVFVATVDESVADFVDRAHGVRGVQVAEPDVWVEPFGAETSHGDVGI